jgi:hypothetical protein
MLPIPFRNLTEGAILDAAKTADTLRAYDANDNFIEQLTGKDRMARVVRVGAPAYVVKTFDVVVTSPEELAQLKAIVAKALGV